MVITLSSVAILYFTLEEDIKWVFLSFPVTELEAGHCQPLCEVECVDMSSSLLTNKIHCLVELPCSYGFEALKGNMPLLQRWVMKQLASVYVKFWFFFNNFLYSLKVCRNVCKITTDYNISRSLWSICLNFKCCICICTAVSDIKPWCMFWIPTNYTISFPFLLLLL